MKLKTLGSLGETFASDFLVAKGYQILMKNFSCKFGEIDIVAFKDNTVFFVEVKTRQSIEFGYPSEAIDHRKRKALEHAAMYYLEHVNSPCDNYQFKVIEILINEFDEIII